MDENKEKDCNCVTETDLNKIRCELIKLPEETPEADEVIVIPVTEYKKLIRCEAAVELMSKLLDKYGTYSNTRGEVIAIACELLGKKEGPFDA